jgi:DAACS family dicarboxylate/amino acid:cation (Na+ or H+) symporter
MAGSTAKLPHTWILLGLLLGAALGTLANYATTPADPLPPVDRAALAGVVGPAAVPPEPEPAPWLVWVVDNVSKPVSGLFMNLLFLPIIPLVFASVVIGVTRIGGMGNLGRIGGKTVGYFLITTLFAAVIGLGLVNLIRPGDQLPKAQQARLSAKYGKESADKVEAGKKKPFGIDTFVNIIPSNPLKEFVNKDNMLAVIFTSILVGIALTQISPDKAARVVELLEGVNQVAEFIIRLAMKCAPLGVFMLMFTTTALFGYQLLLALLAFVLTVLGGLAVHSFVVLPLLVWLLGGMNPIQFYVKSFPSLATAFSTSSSSATLPTAIKNATDDLGVPPTVAQFVLPLSASMNHNGTALFESVVVLFLVQVFGVDLTIGQQIIVLVLCVLTATGMAGVPGGSLPLIGMVLETATEGKVPGAAIAIVLGVDRLLDMCRTTVNVAADLTTAVFVARTEKGRGVGEPALGEPGA